MNLSTHHISGARDGLIPPPRKRGEGGRPKAGRVGVTYAKAETAICQMTKPASFANGSRPRR